jgi:hypothetical protein
MKMKRPLSPGITPLRLALLEDAYFGLALFKQRQMVHT